MVRLRQSYFSRHTRQLIQGPWCGMRRQTRSAVQFPKNVLPSSVISSTHSPLDRHEGQNDTVYDGGLEGETLLSNACKPASSAGNCLPEPSRISDPAHRVRDKLPSIGDHDRLPPASASIDGDRIDRSHTHATRLQCRQRITPDQ